MSVDSIALARSLGAATLHEAAGRIGVVRSEIRPVDPSMVTAGRAHPVQTTPGDNLAVHRAVAAAQPGDVLVVATGDQTAVWGYWGEILSVAARERQLAGLVLEGGSRDHGRLVEVGFPVFSLGACIRGTVKEAGVTAKALSEEVVIGELRITAGDLVVGDQDGVVVIPHDIIDDVLAAGRHREDKERQMMDELRQGRTTLQLLGLDE